MPLSKFFEMSQVIELYHPLVLRLFLMSTHYRSPINYSDAQLESASDRLFYIYQVLANRKTYFVLKEYELIAITINVFADSL